MCASSLILPCMPHCSVHVQMLLHGIPSDGDGEEQLGFLSSFRQLLFVKEQPGTQMLPQAVTERLYAYAELAFAVVRCAAVKQSREFVVAALAARTDREAHLHMEVIKQLYDITSKARGQDQHWQRVAEALGEVFRASEATARRLAHASTQAHAAVPRRPGAGGGGGAGTSARGGSQ